MPQSMRLSMTLCMGKPQSRSPYSPISFTKERIRGISNKKAQELDPRHRYFPWPAAPSTAGAGIKRMAARFYKCTANQFSGLINIPETGSELRAQA